MDLFRSSFAAVAALAATSVASAASVNVSFYRITSNGNQNISSQLALNVSEVAGSSNKIDFTFKNMVGVASSVKEVFFDAGPAGSIFTSGSVKSQSGSAFAWGSSSPGDLPGGSALTPQFQTTTALLADSGAGGPSSGLDSANDSLVLRLTLALGKSYADVVNGLLSVTPGAPGSIRVGLHVIAIGTSGGSDSYATTLLSIPLPPAAWAGLSCLAGVIGAGVIRARIHGRRD